MSKETITLAIIGVVATLLVVLAWPLAACGLGLCVVYFVIKLIASLFYKPPHKSEDN